MRPRVSIVVPNYNHGVHIGEAIDSALGQSYRDLEVIVSDDGSTDGSCAVVEGMIEAGPGSPVRLLRLEHGGSPARTRNAGVAAARGDLICNLDADDRLHPDFLTHAVAALDALPNHGAAYGDQQNFGTDLALIRSPEYSFSNLKHANFIGGNSLYRRRAWEAVGGYDESGIRYEDWDFWIALGAAGWPAVKAHGALWYYRCHAGGRHLEVRARRDRETKAHFVRKRPVLYSPAERAWAQDVLAGDLAEPPPDDTMGRIPSLPAAPATAIAAAHRPGAEPAAQPRVAAIVLALDNAATLPWVLDDLAAQGIAARVIDLGSTDGGPEHAEARGVAIERVGGDAGAALARAEAIAADLDADWIMLQWADEFRESPWPDLTLPEALAFADTLAVNAVAFEVLRFPVAAHERDVDPRELHRGFEWAGPAGVKAWRSRGAGVRLADTGGLAFFADRRVSQLPFLARRYPLGDAGGPLAPYDGGEARAVLLARLTRDLLLGSVLTGADPAVAPLDHDAVASWLGRLLGQAADAADAGHALLGTSADPSLRLAHARLEDLRHRRNGAAITAADALARTEAEVVAGEDGRLSFVTVVGVDDLAGDPDLLETYTRTFGTDEDATLVVLAPGRDEAALTDVLVAALERAGVDLHDAPDILALTCEPDEAADALRHRGAVVVASAADGLPAELGSLPTAALEELRALAETRWAA